MTAMRMICNKMGLTYWADTDNNNEVMSPYFEDEEDAIQWYNRVAEIIVENFRAIDEQQKKNPQTKLHW